MWSCLERAQTGPWQLDARRLSPKAFPHGVLLTFELLLQQPAPPAEPGAREQQSGGWRDCVTVLTFSLDGKTVEIMVDAGGRCVCEADVVAAVLPAMHVDPALLVAAIACRCTLIAK